MIIIVQVEDVDVLAYEYENEKHYYSRRALDDKDDDDGATGICSAHIYDILNGALMIIPTCLLPVFAAAGEVI